MMNLFGYVDITPEEEDAFDAIREKEKTMSTPVNPGSGVGNVHKSGPLVKKKQPKKPAKKK